MGDLHRGEGRSPEEASRALVDGVAGREVPRFTAANLPGGDFWFRAVKTVPTRMVRIEGPFDVETSEGPTHCEDGYLAVDTAGNPYPIAASVFEASYSRLED